MLQESKCIFCSNVFSHKRVSANRPRRFCSTSCSSKNKARVTSKYIYRDIFSKCIECGENFKLIDSSPRKFCSKSCSVTNSNRGRVPSKQHRERTASALRRVPQIIKVQRVKRTFIQHPLLKTCITCGSEFKPHKPSIKNCSSECLSINRSETNRKGGLASAAKRVLRSKDEIELHDLCLAKWPSTKNNEVLKDGWDADIVIHEHMTCVMWNGPWHYKQLTMSKHSLSQVQTRDRIKMDVLTSIGWRVLVFEDRHYTPQSAFVELLELLN